VRDLWESVVTMVFRCSLCEPVAITEHGEGVMIDQEAPEFVASFARGLSVIRSFDHDTPRQTLSEVAERTGMARAAARRFLLTLCALGYARTDGKLFELTPKVLDLGYSYLSSLGLSDMLLPYLRRVTDTLQESSSAAVLDGEDIVYVARSAARHRVMAISLAVGARLPAHCSSMGQVLLANLEPAELGRFLKTAKLQRYTDATLTTPEALERRLQDVRTRGWSMCDQELELGLRSVAVAVRDPKGAVALAMNVSVQATRVSTDVLLRDYLPVLQDAATAFEDLRRLQ